MTYTTNQYTKEEVRRSFWKNVCITIIRAGAGSAYLYFIGCMDGFKRILHLIDSNALKFIVLGIMFLTCAWSIFNIVEIFVNIPGYYDQARRGFTCDPLIRIRFRDMIPNGTHGQSLTVSPETRWQIREATDTVTRHLNTKSRK